MELKCFSQTGRLLLDDSATKTGTSRIRHGICLTISEKENLDEDIQEECELIIHASTIETPRGE